MSAKKGSAVHGPKARGPTRKKTGRSIRRPAEIRPLHQARTGFETNGQADRRQPFMPKSISRPLPSILIPSVSPIARRMRPLSVGRSLRTPFIQRPTTYSMAPSFCKVNTTNSVTGKEHWRLSRCLKVNERGRPRTRSHRRYHTETKHRHDDNKKNPHQGSHEPTEGAIPRPYPVSHGAPRRPRPIFADFCMPSWREIGSGVRHA